MDKKDKVKIRCFPEENYKAIWVGGKTLRISLDPSKPIGELDYPEFYDVKLTNRCDGQCVWCYQDSTPREEHYKDVLRKIYSFFGPMDENQRPFQVAIGGGEPTFHPEFISVLKAFDKLGIVPNYTTNGMFLHRPGAEEIINATKEYCGGVAISCHPHLEFFWKGATARFSLAGVRTNLHLIISDKESVERFKEIYDQYNKLVEYFVLLPHTAQGRAEPKIIDWPNLRLALADMEQNKIAFGANFYPYLMKDGRGLDVSLYEPEIMSKYITLEGKGSMYKSSFSDMNSPIKTNLWD